MYDVLQISAPEPDHDGSNTFHLYGAVVVRCNGQDVTLVFESGALLRNVLETSLVSHPCLSPV